MACTLSTSPFLKHRLTFSVFISFGNTYKVPYHGSSVGVDAGTVNLDLHTSALLTVGHGPFGWAEVAVQPVRLSPPPCCLSFQKEPALLCAVTL